MRHHVGNAASQHDAASHCEPSRHLDNGESDGPIESEAHDYSRMDFACA